MNHAVAVCADDSEVVLGVELGRASVQVREGREVMSLDVAVPKLAVLLAVIEAADGTSCAVNPLGVRYEPGLSLLLVGGEGAGPRQRR